MRRAIGLIELQDRRYLDETVPAKVRDNWLIQLMREKYPEPMTVLEWLRRPPRKRSRKTLDEEISKWAGDPRHDTAIESRSDSGAAITRLRAADAPASAHQGSRDCRAPTYTRDSGTAVGDSGAAE